MKKDGTAWVVSFESDRIAVFDVVILANGFGEEKNTQFRYWDRDNLKSSPRSGGNVLVSGRGDGGLTDTIRLAIAEFDHAWIEDLAASSHLDDAKPKLLQIEDDDSIHDVGLLNEYLAISVPAFDELLRNKLEPGVKTYLHCRTKSLSRRSSILNRFLVSRLIKIGAVEIIDGEHDFEADPTPTEICGVNINPVVHVIRNGTKPALELFDSEIWDALQFDRKLRREKPNFSDVNRFPIWDGEFGNASHHEGSIKWHEGTRYTHFEKALVDHLNKFLGKARWPIVGIADSPKLQFAHRLDAIIYDIPPASVRRQLDHPFSVN